jgi:hypothetical protein
VAKLAFSPCLEESLSNISIPKLKLKEHLTEVPEFIVRQCTSGEVLYRLRRLAGNNETAALRRQNLGAENDGTLVLHIIGHTSKVN